MAIDPLSVELARAHVARRKAANLGEAAEIEALALDIAGVILMIYGQTVRELKEKNKEE